MVHGVSPKSWEKNKRYRSSSSSSKKSRSPSSSRKKRRSSSSPRKKHRSPGEMKSVGSKHQVGEGRARRTSGRLTRDDLMKNKFGKWVSRERHKQAKKAMQNPEKKYLHKETGEWCTLKRYFQLMRQPAYGRG